jgi:hypothetical protein
MHKDRIKKQLERMNEAASMIQRNYREHHRITMLPKAIKEYKNRAAILVQRHMRGYIVAVKRYKEHRSWRIDKHMAFFDDLRTNMVITPAVMTL